MVLREICEHPFYTAKTIADNIGKSEKTVSRAIKKLKDNDRIERSGSDYNGYWIVKNGF
jgi:predicted HTH transcriptional regulator